MKLVQEERGAMESADATADRSSKMYHNIKMPKPPLDRLTLQMLPKMCVMHHQHFLIQSE